MENVIIEEFREKVRAYVYTTNRGRTYMVPYVKRKPPITKKDIYDMKNMILQGHKKKVIAKIYKINGEKLNKFLAITFPEDNK